jgi:tryptophan 7-halogenase
MKKIIVLGGGAAGWLTSLFVKKIYPQNEVTLIESKKIGILGAGEGSTPHLVSFLNFLNINIFDLLSKTKGTLKYGINFENWNGDNKKYFHGFSSLNELNKFSVKNSFTHDCYDKYLIDCVSKNLNLNECLHGSLLNENKKVDILNENFSLHFDAHKIANYLKEIATQRGVIHVEGEVLNLSQDEKGNITSVTLQNKAKHFCDFIFDCSGFKRLIIGEIFQTQWVDYQKHLPMKKAVPFFLEQENEIMPCTHAIAMKYGWIWKIPLQHRFGAGYIYDSDFINSEQALIEAEKHFGFKLDSPRIISFNAGRFENVWVKNCIAVGLSAGFTEPLEATSLYITSQQLMLLAHYKEDLFDISEYKRKNFNLIIKNTNDEILAFLYLHYLTKRNDSDFWKNFKNNTVIPEFLVERLNSLKEANFIPQSFDLNRCVAGFELNSYIVVGNGLGLIKEKTKPVHGLHPDPNKYKKQMNMNLSKLQGHREFLESLNVPNNY